MKLRKYERDWVSRIRLSKARRVLIVGPTGCGKTVVAVELIREAIRANRRVLFLAHRRELVAQAKQRLIDHGVDSRLIGTILATEKENREPPVQVASVQTLVRRATPQADLVFVDEAHHAAAASYRKIVDAYPGALLFGLTATPYRLDGKTLGDLFDEIVESEPPSKLIESGWLCRPRVWTVPVDERPDLSGVKMSGGDFNLGQLDKASRRRGLVGNIVDHWKRLAENRPTVCYSVSVKHGQQIRDAFMSSGVNAELLTGETKVDIRAGMLARLATGETSVVVNCMVLTEGWDCPDARCAIVARPTMSQSLWFQMAGRVMRKHDVEPIILDHAGNALIHPLPGTDIEHSLTEAQRKARRPGQAKEKVCGDCGSSIPLGCRVCPNCWYEFWTGEIPEEALGELWEIEPRLRDAEICESYRNGDSVQSIANRLGCSRTVITKRLRRNGVKSRSQSEAKLGFTLDEKAVVKAYRNGDSPTEIAERLGCGRTTIDSCLKRNCVNARSMSEAKLGFVLDDKSVVNAYRNGDTELVIAKRLGCSKATIAYRLKRNGVKMRPRGRSSSAT